MPRRPIKKKRVLLADPVYNSISVNMLVNRVMKSGKKSVAYRIVYNTLKEIGETTQKNPVEVFEMALENVMPQVEVKPRRNKKVSRIFFMLLNFSKINLPCKHNNKKR